MNKFLQHLRTCLAVFACRTSRVFLRLLGRGGTHLPGKIALRIYPELLARLAKGVHVTVVTGTNGKTTSTRMLEAILQQADFSHFSNRTGANLHTGITAAFIEHAGLFGKPKKTHALIECDEAEFARIAPQLGANIILITNIFRDQLDRYGSLNHTVEAIRRGVEASPDVTVCYNADCAFCGKILHGLPNKTVPFGINALVENQDKQTVVETTHCPKCDHTLMRHSHTYGHLGDWACSSCGTKRPKLHVGVENILAQLPEMTKFRVEIGENIQDFTLPMPGLYSVYNAAGAIGVASSLQISLETVASAFAAFDGGFGRMERFRLGNTDACMILVKNPIGLSQTLRYLTTLDKPFALAFLLNDHAGDGRDISWIWDAEMHHFHALKPHLTTLLCGGIRGTDAAVWGKYAGIDPERIITQSDDGKLLQLLADSPVPVYILPTYSAMIGLRGILSKAYGLKRFWK